jgi:hypothetical protein
MGGAYTDILTPPLTYLRGGLDTHFSLEPVLYDTGQATGSISNGRATLSDSVRYPASHISARSEQPSGKEEI